MKKLITIIVATLCSLQIWAYDFYRDGIYYNYLDYRSVEVTYSNYTDYSGTVRIPSTVNYYGTTYNVVRIGGSAFKNCYRVVAVSIPNSVAEIADNAFNGCSGIQSIDLPNSLRRIGKSAFAHCSEIKKIKIPNTVISVGSYAFYNCSNLKNITLSSALEEIPQGMLSNCTELRSISIPSRVSYIGEEAFDRCRSLTSVTIPNTVEEVGSNVFSYCTQLTSVTLGQGLSYLSSSMFYGCSSLKTIKIPNNITAIYSSAFRDCQSLESISLSMATNSIGSYAFAGCSNLKVCKLTATNLEQACQSNTLYQLSGSGCRAPVQLFIAGKELTDLVIPVTITKFADKAFYGYNGITSLTITADNLAQFCQSTASASLHAAGLTMPRKVVIAGQEVTDLVVPVTITNIAKEAFKGCTGITSLTLTAESLSQFCQSTTNPSLYAAGLTMPRKVLIAGQELTDLVVPVTLTDITPNIFQGCDGITSLTLTADNLAQFCQSTTNPSLYAAGLTMPRKVVIAGQEVTDLVVPVTLTDITPNAFQGCDGITSLTLTADDFEQACRSTTNASLHAAGLTMPRKLMVAGQEITDLVIPPTVDYLAEDALKGCDGITSLVLSANSIEEYCSSSANKALYAAGIELPRKLLIAGQMVTDLVIPASVSYIAPDAFKGCTTIRSIEWNAISCNSSHPFASISHNITSFTIGHGVRLLPEGLCSNMIQLTSVVIPSSVTSIGKTAFYGCKGLTSIVIPMGVTAIETRTFAKCSSLASVEIPATVTSIDNGAFYECRSLTEVKLPSSVRYIGERAFYNCASIQSVNIPGYVSQIKPEAFKGCSSMTHVKIAKGVSSIGESAFEGCHNLKSIHLPKTVTYIGQKAFAYCSTIKKVNIPKHVQRVDHQAFSGCSNLKSARVEDEKIAYNDSFPSDTKVRERFPVLLAILFFPLFLLGL